MFFVGQNDEALAKAEAESAAQRKKMASVAVGTFHIDRQGTVMYIACCATSALMHPGEVLVLEFESVHMNRVQRSLSYVAKENFPFMYAQNGFRPISGSYESIAHSVSFH